MQLSDWIIIILYLVAMLGIGFFAKGKIQTMDDFILGGKRLLFGGVVRALRQSELAHAHANGAGRNEHDATAAVLQVAQRAAELIDAAQVHFAVFVFYFSAQYNINCHQILINKFHTLRYIHKIKTCYIVIKKTF